MARTGTGGNKSPSIWDTQDPRLYVIPPASSVKLLRADDSIATAFKLGHAFELSHFLELGLVFGLSHGVG